MFRKTLVLLAILALPLATFGAISVAKEIKSWENIVQIMTNDGKNVHVYKFEDSGNSCYVAYTSGWTSGNNTNISCVNTPVVPVVKK